MSRIARYVLEPPRAVLIYGSHATGTVHAKSDLDVLFVGGATPAAVNRLRAALTVFSHSHGLSSDAEVPFENKLLCEWSELDAAASCQVFLNEAGRRVLSPVIREPWFLGSQAMRERLFLNVLVQPTISWSEDEQRLAALQRVAQRGLIETAVETLEINGTELTADAVVEILIRSSGVSGKDYIGFMPEDATRVHLHSFVKPELERLGIDSAIKGLR